MSDQVTDKDLPDGDFTISEYWPRMLYGQPREGEILDAQNQVLGKHMVKEAGRREKFEKLVLSELTSQKEL